MLGLAFVCIAPLHSVHAYIDPGTGSYLLQIILAALFGLMFALKVFWTKIKDALTRMRMLLFKSKHESIGS